MHRAPRSAGVHLRDGVSSVEAREVLSAGGLACDTDVPMRLITAHKILISAALALAVLLAIRAGFNYSSNHMKSEASSAVAGLVMAGVLAAYLRTIWRR
jgi:hypothetical protein